jgi:hypothetical protein
MLSLWTKRERVAGCRSRARFLGQLAQALVTIQRALLPLLAGLIGKRALLGRFVGELHSPAVGGPDRILNVIDGTSTLSGGSVVSARMPRRTSSAFSCLRSLSCRRWSRRFRRPTRPWQPRHRRSPRSSPSWPTA